MRVGGISAVALVVVGAEGEEVANFLIKALFRGANVTDALQHFAKMIRAAVEVFQAFVAHRKTLEQVFLEDGRGPAAKRHATR